MKASYVAIIAILILSSTGNFLNIQARCATDANGRMIGYCGLGPTNANITDSNHYDVNHTMPVNSTRTQYYGWVTPIQSSQNESKLTIHYENGTTQYLNGTVYPMGPDFGLPSPLKQFKSGIEPTNTTCQVGLALIFKSRDGSPACVKPDTAQKLIERGWGESLQNLPISPITMEITGLNQTYETGHVIIATVKYTGYEQGGVYPDVKILDANNTQIWSNCCISHTETPSMHFGTFTYNAEGSSGYPIINKTGTYTITASLDNVTADAIFDVIQSNDIQVDSQTNLENDTGVVTLSNHTYYFMTPNYTNDAYSHPVQVSFQNVVFTLFPSGFKGGLPAWGCGGQYYWTNAKFLDGTSELLHIFVGSQDCSLPQPSTYFSTHTNPQTGLTFYDGKMKLLVNIENEFMIHALVVQTPPFMGGCDNPPCHHSGYVLKINSQKHAFLTGYDICKEILCSSENKLSVSLDETYVMIPIVHDIHLKVGDIVNIRVKISSLYNMAGNLIPNPLNMSFVDLGNSKVIVD